MQQKSFSKHRSKPHLSIRESPGPVGRGFLFRYHHNARGERKEDGTWPEGTFNFLVDRRLREMAKKLKADEKGEKEPEKKKEENNDEPPKKEPGA